jgi:xanthine/uracil permease
LQQNAQDPLTGRFYTIRGVMRRAFPILVLVLTIGLVLAPVALGHDGGEGTYGETNDKVVTNAGFILIAFFPLFVFAMSMLQMALDRRKERRKAAHKALAREDRVRGGW